MTLIKAAQIIDGSGAPSYKGDVLIKDDTISAIGSFPSQKADQVIDGLGYILSPGFIDVNTDSDHLLSLFTYPAQQDFLLQGVTTIIGGHCGASLAPLLYGTLESIRKWTDINQVNVDWQTMADFFQTLGRFKIGVNFGTLIGHSTVRRALIGEDLRDLTIPETEVFAKVVERALEEGALGFSTGLGYVHARNTPYNEIKTLADVVAKYNGVYATHLRDERNGLVAAVQETIKIAEESKVRTLISHFHPILGFEKEFEAALKLLEGASRSANIHFDSYPFDTTLTPIYTLLPRWAQNGGLEVMLDNIHSDPVRERILKELPKLGPDTITVSSAPAAEYLIGKNLGQYAANNELSLDKALLQMMSASRMRAAVLYKNLNGPMVIESIKKEQALIASNSGSVSEESKMLKPERAKKTFTRFLEIMLAEKSISMEEVIKKITYVPAMKFNIKNRGLIKEGYRADLVLLKNEKPEYVFVNGQLAVKEGRAAGLLAGQLIKRS